MQRHWLELFPLNVWGGLDLPVAATGPSVYLEELGSIMRPLALSNNFRLFRDQVETSMHLRPLLVGTSRLEKSQPSAISRPSLSYPTIGSLIDLGVA